jgi:hypothetical protein
MKIVILLITYILIFLISNNIVDARVSSDFPAHKEAYQVYMEKNPGATEASAITALKENFPNIGDDSLYLQNITPSSTSTPIDPTPSSTQQNPASVASDINNTTSSQGVPPSTIPPNTSLNVSAVDNNLMGTFTA